MAIFKSYKLKTKSGKILEIRNLNLGDEGQLEHFNNPCCHPMVATWVLKYMNRILAPDFFEFGRSGRIYQRTDTLSISPQEIKAKLSLKNFAIHPISQDVVLVTYISEVEYEKIEIGNRNSIWSKTEKR